MIGADNDLATAKRQARAVAASERAKAHVRLHDVAPLALARIGLAFASLAPASTISGFYPQRSEIDTVPLLARLASEGFITALPIVVGKEQRLLFRAWTPGDAVVPGVWDIPMPRNDARVVEPDGLLVPMLAFDAQGYRLGYGGGYYDRTLFELRREKSLVAIGVAYSAQEMDAVPRGAYDAPLDFILTEQGFRRCG